MTKGLVLKRVSMMVGMLAVCLLVVLILPSFSASAAGPVTSITLDRTSITLYTTQKTTLIATVLPADATNTSVVWSSGDTNIATVNASGVVTGVSFGLTTITATAADGSGVYATCECMVSPYVVNYFGKTNQDARRVHFQFDTGTDISLIYLHVGSRVFYVNRPVIGTPYDDTINSERIKVSVTLNSTSTRYVWDVQLKLTPTPYGTKESIYLELWNGYYMARSDAMTNCAFWDLGLTTSGSTMGSIYSSFSAVDSASVKVVNCMNYQSVTTGSDGSAATGTLLIAYDSMDISDPDDDLIYRLLYVAKFGDVTGGTDMGDGDLANDDATAILYVSAHMETFQHYIFQIAADIDNDGAITVSDAFAVLHAVSNGNNSIYPGYSLSSIPDELYYDDTVTFT